jgi:hypothetical protein
MRSSWRATRSDTQANCLRVCKSLCRILPPSSSPELSTSPSCPSNSTNSGIPCRVQGFLVRRGREIPMTRGLCIEDGQCREPGGSLKTKSESLHNNCIQRGEYSQGIKKTLYASVLLWMALEHSSRATSAIMGGGAQMYAFSFSVCLGIHILLEFFSPPRIPCPSQNHSLGLNNLLLLRLESTMT